MRDLDEEGRDEMYALLNAPLVPAASDELRRVLGV